MKLLKKMHSEEVVEKLKTKSNMRLKDKSHYRHRSTMVFGKAHCKKKWFQEGAKVNHPTEWGGKIWVCKVSCRIGFF